MKSFRSACYVPCTYRVKLLMTLIEENQLHPKDNSQTIFLNGIYEYEDLDDPVAFCSRFMLILQQPLSLLIKPQSACCSVWVSGAGVAARFFLLLLSAEHVAMLTRADSEIARKWHH